MKTISKHFKTLKAAENYQTMLYDKYNSVSLIAFPAFSESGFYVWRVEH